MHIDKSPEMQAQRKKFIQMLIKQGVVPRVSATGGDLPKMYVKPAFYSLEFFEKQQFASVVYAYYFDGSNISDRVIL